MNRRTLYSICCVLAPFGDGCAFSQPESKERKVGLPYSDVPIVALIDNLASERFTTRQAAAKQLRIRAKEAVPELLKAADNSANREIKAEATKLVESILWPKDEPTGKKQLCQVPDYLKNGQIDLAIECIAHWHLYADWDTRKLLVDHAHSLAERYEKQFKAKLPRPRGGEASMQKGEHVQSNGSSGGAIAYVLDGHAESNAVIVASQLNQRFGISDCVILCNSGSTPKRIRSSIVIANGDLTIDGSIDESLVLCNGDVVLGYPRKCVVIARGKIKSGTKELFDSYLVPNEPGLFENIVRFDLKSLGFSLKCSDGVVTIAETVPDRNGRPPLKSGDRVIAVNGRPIDSIEMVYRLLRRSHISGSPITVLTIKRSDQLLYSCVH